MEYEEEVMDYMSCLTEYDEAKVMAMIREEALEEGLEKGRKQAQKEIRMELLMELVKDGGITLEKAAERVDMTVEQFKSYMENCK